MPFTFETEVGISLLFSPHTHFILPCFSPLPANSLYPLPSQPYLPPFLALPQFRGMPGMLWTLFRKWWVHL